MRVGPALGCLLTALILASCTADERSGDAIAESTETREPSTSSAQQHSNPPCLIADLSAVAPLAGGAALGTWYLPFTIVNHGPACFLGDASLTIWGGSAGNAKLLARLDLADHVTREVMVRRGERVNFRVGGPNEGCGSGGDTAHDTVAVSLTVGSADDSPHVMIRSGTVPIGFAFCGEAFLLADNEPY